MAYKTIYPYTNEVLHEYDNVSDADVEKALETGLQLYKQWRRKDNLEDRKAQLRKVKWIFVRILQITMLIRLMSF